MKCPECGANLSSEDKFCNNCGAVIPGGQATSADDPPAAPSPLLDNDNQLEEIEPIEQESEADNIAPLPPSAAPQPDFGRAAAAPPPPPPPPPVIKAKGKKNTGLIIAIVVLVVLLLCCCCAIGLIVANFEQISQALEAYY